MSLVRGGHRDRQAPKGKKLFHGIPSNPKTVRRSDPQPGKPTGTSLTLLSNALHVQLLSASLKHLRSCRVLGIEAMKLQHSFGPCRSGLDSRKDTNGTSHHRNPTTATLTETRPIH